MKKIIIFSSIFTTFISVSCQKECSCTCTTTLREKGYLPYQTATVQKINKRTSKKKAEKICKNTAIQMQANSRLLFDDNIEVETSCSVQEN